MQINMFVWCCTGKATGARVQEQKAAVPRRARRSQFRRQAPMTSLPAAAPLCLLSCITLNPSCPWGGACGSFEIYHDPCFQQLAMHGACMQRRGNEEATAQALGGTPMGHGLPRQACSRLHWTQRQRRQQSSPSRLRRLTRQWEAPAENGGPGRFAGRVLSSLRSCSMCPSAAAQAGTVNVMHAGAAAKERESPSRQKGLRQRSCRPIPLPDGRPMPEAAQARSIDRLCTVH